MYHWVSQQGPTGIGFDDTEVPPGKEQILGRTRCLGCDGNTAHQQSVFVFCTVDTPNTESTPETTSQWATDWLDGVADGSNTMSPRKWSSVEKRGGGLEAVKALARERNIHLLLLEDDKGNEPIAASVKPFEPVRVLRLPLGDRLSSSGGLLQRRDILCAPQQGEALQSIACERAVNKSGSPASGNYVDATHRANEPLAPMSPCR